MHRSYRPVLTSSLLTHIAGAVARTLAALAAPLIRGPGVAPPQSRVADADHLREQLRLACQSATHDGYLLMLDIDHFHLVNRDFGRQEGDRVLHAVTQVLLLNLRSTDLLCRYAGDRFAVMLPHTPPDTAHALADHLRRAVASLHHHAHRSGLPIRSTVRYALRTIDAEPRQLLKEMNRALERRMPVSPDLEAALAPSTVAA
jgi:diguanylate cyclase (GGDEF)-like protein